MPVRWRHSAPHTATHTQQEVNWGHPAPSPSSLSHGAWRKRSQGFSALIYWSCTVRITTSVQRMCQLCVWWHAVLCDNVALIFLRAFFGPCSMCIRRVLVVPHSPCTHPSFEHTHTHTHIRLPNRTAMAAPTSVRSLTNISEREAGVFSISVCVSFNPKTRPIRRSPPTLLSSHPLSAHAHGSLRRVLMHGPHPVCPLPNT